MRNLNYELIINRNETFTLDFEIVNQDGSPYIVSKYLKNPHVLITISSVNKLSKPYVCNYWLKLNELPKFEYTQPVEVDDFDNYPFVNEDEHLTGDVAVFVKTNADGTKIYKYWKNGEYYDYSFRIVKRFSVEDTSVLTAQNYEYTIKLVTGTKDDDSDVPITKFEDVIIILPSTRIIVNGDPNGGLKW